MLEVRSGWGQPELAASDSWGHVERMFVSRFGLAARRAFISSSIQIIATVTLKRLYALEKHSFSLTVKLDMAFSKSVNKPIIARVDTGNMEAAEALRGFLYQDRLVIRLLKKPLQWLIARIASDFTYHHYWLETTYQLTSLRRKRRPNRPLSFDDMSVTR